MLARRRAPAARPSSQQHFVDAAVTAPRGASAGGAGIDGMSQPDPGTDPGLFGKLPRARPGTRSPRRDGGADERKPKTPRVQTRSRPKTPPRSKPLPRPKAAPRPEPPPPRSSPREEP